MGDEGHLKPTSFRHFQNLGLYRAGVRIDIDFLHGCLKRMTPETKARDLLSIRAALFLPEDAVAALPASIHAHIKDVKRTPEGWFFAAVGEGDIDCRKLLGEIAGKPDLPISIEFPARLHRRADAQPVRRISPASLREIEAALTVSLDAVRGGLTAQEGGTGNSISVVFIR